MVRNRISHLFSRRLESVSDYRSRHTYYHLARPHMTRLRAPYPQRPLHGVFFEPSSLDAPLLRVRLV